MQLIDAVPWLTEAAIWFLDKYVRANMRVLEFGMGGSTLWLVTRCNLISVEHERQWYDACRHCIPSDAHWEGHLLPRPYHGICEQLQKHAFDLVLIDGRDRALCLQAAIPLIKPGGYLMLDNAERRHYARVYVPLLNEWDETQTTQRQPDRLGRGRKGRMTTWWQKPQEGAGEDN